MIDFSSMPISNKAYSGANGKKLCVIYNGARYMLKFPSLPKKKNEISYTSSCISEYIGCHILSILGINTQETLLGSYNVSGKEKLVVACRDFTRPGVVLQDFASLKNRIIDSGHNGYSTDLDDILLTIDSQRAVDRDELLRHFWNMFIGDALIGNFDRHNGNWGFLYDEENDSVSIAPVFDCGSCLYPQANNETMARILKSEDEQNARVFTFPTSAIQKDSKKINYFDFISSLQDEDCSSALLRLYKKMDLSLIRELIDSVECISSLQKEFYFTMIKKRKECIIDFTYNLLQRKDATT